MITQTFGTTRMHYNSDLSGEVIIQDDRSKKQISIPVTDVLALGKFIASESANKSDDLVDCKICGGPATVPTTLDGGDHRHHLVICPDCGIEVCCLEEDSAREKWNHLMSVNS